MNLNLRSFTKIICVFHVVLTIFLIVLMVQDGGWIQNDLCDGGLRTYRCETFEGRRKYEDACDRVMNMTLGLMVVALMAFGGAETMCIILCARVLSKIHKWYGYLALAHSGFGALMLLGAWAYLSSNKNECWKNISHGARGGDNIDWTIIIWILYMGVTAAHCYLGMKIWRCEKLDEKGLLDLFGRRKCRRPTTREHLLVSSNDDEYSSSSYEAPNSEVKQIALALHDCDGDNEDELSFRKGDALQLHEREGDWWVASLNGKRGLVPVNYVDKLSDEL